jgi:transcriptional regulator with XRE-family HTH domain
VSHTKAGRRLAELLSPQPPEARKTQAGLAKELGVTPQAVSGWMHGRGRPSPRIMKLLEESLEIPMRDWLEPADESNGDNAA